MKTSAILVMIYGILLLLGGMVGFLKAGSTASLIAGSITALIALSAGIFLLKNQIAGLWIALGISLILAFFFGYRFYASQKMMPAGLMALISLGILLLLLFFGRTKIFAG
jgi:uncharacterized membrane protein (UPF0136 family)